jgi:hypothetical protein
MSQFQASWQSAVIEELPLIGIELFVTVPTSLALLPRLFPS